MNSHPRDQRIVFDEGPHTYLLDGTVFLPSTTTHLSAYFDKFDAWEIVKKMNLNAPHNKLKYGGMTREQIVAKWTLDGQTASRLGTEMHAMIENAYIRMQRDGRSLPRIKASSQTVELKYFENFARRYRGIYAPYRMEWVVFDEDMNLAGSIDMVFAKTGSLSPRHVSLCDWKRSVCIKMENSYRRCKPPISHLDDCNFNKYALQLNTYKRILEKSYNLVVDEMFLVVCHPSNDDYIRIDIPDMQAEIDAIFPISNEFDGGLF